MPMEIWQSQLAVAEKVLAEAQAGPEDLAAIGITNQRETVLLWDRATGEPLHNAIVWQCRRTAAVCDRIRAEGFDRILREKTGLVTDAYFSGTKIAWLLENVPGRPREGAARRTGLRDHRHLADLATHARARACHGRFQCLADPALQPAHAGLGPANPELLCHSRVAPAGGETVERHLW